MLTPAADLKTHVEPTLSARHTTLSGTTADEGSSVDCKAYSGPVYALASVGSATSETPDVDVKLQESDDGSTNWTDLAVQTAVTLSADNTCVILRGIRTKRYVRTHATPAFSGSGAVEFASYVLGQLQTAPA